LPSIRTRVAAVLVLASGALAAPLAAYTPEQLYRDWPGSRFVTASAACIRPDDLQARIDALVAEHPGELRVESLGESVQGRPIRLLTLGSGPRPVLLWSQMHGDEPSATPALLDLADYLLDHRGEREVDAVLRELTVLLVPMLNPDGSEVYQRENAMSIDINRDALNLVTPEGRILKQVRDEHRPVLGFNLHDQNRRRTAGGTKVLATNAVLAVSGDEANTLTEGRKRAKRAASAIVDALGRFYPGGMARYDETFSPRAFGDNLTAWGTPVVLIESGGVPPGTPLSELTRLNFVALLTALGDLALDDLAGHDPALYDDLPENDLGDWVDVVVRGGSIRQPGSTAPYRADLAFDLLQADRVREGCADRGRRRSEIQEVGDDRYYVGGTELDAAGAFLLAPFRVGVEGRKAKRWLAGETLARLAALGVGEVVWAVKDKDFIEGEKLASEWNGPGRARLGVIAGDLPKNLLRLRSEPASAGRLSLSAVFSSLAGAAAQADVGKAGFDETLAQLWGGGDPPRARAVLAPDRAASFLLVEGDENGGLSGASAIRSVWLDGIEVGAGR